MIRRAKFSDIPAIFALMVEAYQRSKYRDRGTLDEKEAKAFLMRAMQRDGSRQEGGTIFRVAEKDGAVTGFILGLLQRVYQVGTQLEAQQVYFYQTPGADPIATIELAVDFGKWAQAIPRVISVQQSATDIITEFPEAARLYEGLGYKQTGVIYEKVLQ